MSHELPPCPTCQSALTSEDGALLECPECAHDPDWRSDGFRAMPLERQVVKKP